MYSSRFRRDPYRMIIDRARQRRSMLHASDVFETPLRGNLQAPGRDLAARRELSFLDQPLSACISSWGPRPCTSVASCGHSRVMRTLPPSIMRTAPSLPFRRADNLAPCDPKTPPNPSETPLYAAQVCARYPNQVSVSNFVFSSFVSSFSFGSPSRGQIAVSSSRKY